LIKKLHFYPFQANNQKIIPPSSNKPNKKKNFAQQKSLLTRRTIIIPVNILATTIHHFSTTAQIQAITSIIVIINIASRLSGTGSHNRRQRRHDLIPEVRLMRRAPLNILRVASSHLKFVVVIVAHGQPVFSRRCGHGHGVHVRVDADVAVGSAR